MNDVVSSEQPGSEVPVKTVVSVTAPEGMGIDKIEVPTYDKHFVAFITEDGIVIEKVRCFQSLCF